MLGTKTRFADPSQEAYAKAKVVFEELRAEKLRRVEKWNDEWRAETGGISSANEDEWIEESVDFEMEVEKELGYWEALELLRQAEFQMILWGIKTVSHLATPDQRLQICGVVEMVNKGKIAPHMRENLVKLFFKLNPNKGA